MSTATTDPAHEALDDCEQLLDQLRATIANQQQEIDSLRKREMRNVPGSTQVVYKTDSALAEAVEFAHKEAAKRYPGGEVMIGYIDGLIRQYLAGSDTRKSRTPQG